MNLTTILIALLTALPPTLLALAALVSSIKNGKKLQEVHLSQDGRITQLIAAAKAQGAIDQREYQDQQTAPQAAIVEKAANTAKTVVETAAKAATVTIDKAAKVAAALKSSKGTPRQ